jgi:hypothetical protein
MRPPRQQLICTTLWGALLIAPALIQLGYLASFGVNVPYWDQWDFVPMLRKTLEGKLTLHDVWEPYAEQRLVFPRLAMLGLAMLTHYDVTAEMYLSWLLLGATCGIIYVLCRPLLPRSPLGLLLFLPVPWLLFSVRQWDSLLWGWQVQRYMALLFFVTMVWLLTRTRELGFMLVLAIVCAAASSLSLSSGLLSWPIGVLQLLLQGRSTGAKPGRRASIRLPLTFAVCGLAIVLLYLKDYHPPENHPGLSDVIRQPLNAFRYLLVGMANPLSVEKENAVAIGSFIGCCYLVALALAARAALTGRLASAVPISLLLFGLLDICLLVVGRSGLGVGQALESRYAAEISLGIIGLYFTFLADRLLQPSIRSGLVGLVSGALIVGLGTGFQRGMAEGYDLYLKRSQAAATVRAYAQVDLEALRTIGPEPELVRRQARWLAQSGLGPFHAGTTAASAR